MNYQEQQKMRERMKEVERQVKDVAEQLRVALERLSDLESKKSPGRPRKQ